MSQGMKRDTALQICRMSKHQFYYRRKPKTRAGKPVSSQTLYYDELVDNSVITDLIREIQSDQDTDYGYQKTHRQLIQCGFTINHKKVYRLMKESGLLKEKIRPVREKQYVRYRVVSPEKPLHVLEMDIKMVWVAEYRRHAYVLNIIDTFTRSILYWSVGYQMRQKQIRHALSQVIEKYLQPYDMLKENLHVELRNDNGSQFCARSVKQFLEENHVKQTFTHPYTPEENGHVESFHNILKKALGKHAFWSLSDLEERLKGFYETYNKKRLHASTAYLAPHQFWKCWEEGLIDRIEMEKKRVKFKLNVPYQQLSGFENLREVFCADFTALEGLENQKKQNSYENKKAA